MGGPVSMRNPALQFHPTPPAESRTSIVTFVDTFAAGNVQRYDEEGRKLFAGPTIGVGPDGPRYHRVTVRSSGSVRSSDIVHETSIVVPASKQPEREREGADTLGGSFKVKVQGFGTMPGTMSLPSRSLAVTTRAIYVTPGTRSVVRVTRVELRLQLSPPPVGDGNRIRLMTGSIGSLNVTTTSAPSGTLLSWSRGTVDTMKGLVHAVMNDHGFGTGPATSGRLSLRSSAATCTRYAVQLGKAATGVRRKTSGC